MVDRIASDHPSIESVRATVIRHGGRRHRLRLPPAAADAVPADGVIETIVDERTRFASCRLLDGSPSIVGLYDTRAAAAGSVDGENGLDAWLAAADRRPGTSVHVDIIASGRRIGLREPGSTAVYAAIDGPRSSLDAIARELDNE